MILSPGVLNAHVERMGQDALWRQASPCVCWNPNSGAARVNCPMCHALGWRWAAGEDVTIGATGQSVQKLMAQFGAYEVGDLLITVPSDSPAWAQLGRYDRFVLKNSMRHFSEALTKGDGDGYLRGSLVIVERVYWLSSDGESQVEAVQLPFVDPVSGVVQWPNPGSTPPDGRNYVIAGQKADEFFVFPAEAANRNHFHGAALPKKVLGRRFDLFGREQPTGA